MMIRLFHAFLIVCLFAAPALWAGTSEWDLVRTYHSSPGKNLVIDLNSGGDITVTGTQGNDVQVQARRSGEDRENLKVEAQETSSGVEIHSSYIGNRRHYNANVDIEVQVPFRYDIALETMGGDVKILNIQGKMTGKTMGGDLELQKLKGSVDLTTMGGEIHASDSDLDGSLETMGGDVVFHNVAGSVHGSTMGGDMRTEGAPPSSGKSSSGEKRIHSMGGDLILDAAPDGASLETMGGDIQIGSASDHVFAKTMGGDIDIKSVDGWVTATTMGGDVEVHMIGDPSRGKHDVEITSMGGDIELTVPQDFPMTLDLETSFRKGSLHPPKIDCDFPIQIDESSDCESDYRGHCESLRGTGKVGNGTHRVHITTHEGNITIRKNY